MIRTNSGHRVKGSLRLADIGIKVLGQNITIESREAEYGFRKIQLPDPDFWTWVRLLVPASPAERLTDGSCSDGACDLVRGYESLQAPT